jgi:DNA mismatch repair protein MutS
LPLASSLNPCDDVVSLIRSAIVDDPPASVSAGGAIQPGFSAELDAIVTAARDAKGWVASLEARERERTGVRNLKVGYNKVFGYYVEVTKANLSAVPDEYIRLSLVRVVTGVNRQRGPLPADDAVLACGDSVIDTECAGSYFCEHRLSRLHDCHNPHLG